MGPRSRRRLAIGAGALGTAAVIVAAFVLLTRSGSAAKLGSYVGPTDRRYDANNARLVYGMTKRQVIALLGPPQKTAGRCLEYQVNEALRGATLNATRVCFDSGAYSDQQQEVDGEWNPAPTVQVRRP